MANNHEQFIAFNDSITLTDNRKKKLISNKKAIRKRIAEYYTEHYPEDLKPKFAGQGSFEMKTILNPLKSGDDGDKLPVYDLDYGVYFISKETKDKLLISEYYKKIKKAVDGHTSIAPTEKKTCIRVEYADGHHIDLPIYFKLDYEWEKPTLAHKDGWISSDPREFYLWFNAKAKANQQLRRIVKYLKAWCDYCYSQNDSVKMPSGFILTILAVNNFVANDRDDIAMRDILHTINSNLKSKFSCIRPTTPSGEELLGDNFSDTRKKNFMAKLDSFATSADHAINETNPKKACLKWQKHFGDRFCCSTAKDEDEDVIRQNSAPIINKDARNA